MSDLLLASSRPVSAKQKGHLRDFLSLPELQPELEGVPFQHISVLRIDRGLDWFGETCIDHPVACSWEPLLHSWTQGLLRDTGVSPERLSEYLERRPHTVACVLMLTGVEPAQTFFSIGDWQETHGEFRPAVRSRDGASR